MQMSNHAEAMKSQQKSAIMKLGFRMFFPFFVLLFFSLPIQAQFAKPQYWFAYNHSGRFDDRWSYNFDLNYRSTGLIPLNSSLIAARVGMNYHTNTGFRLTGGYAWFGTFVPDEDRSWLNEDRAYQQIQYNHKKGEINLVHRLRIEQRWRQQFTDESLDETISTFTNRYRYLIQFDGPITNYPENKIGFRWQLANEFFIHNKEQVGYMLFDQNRTLAGVLISPPGNISIAVLYQLIAQQQPFLKETFLINSFRITLFQTLDFRKKKKNIIEEEIPVID
jgi:hypothetical protein